MYNTNLYILLPYCAVSTNSMSKTRIATDGCNGLFNPLTDTHTQGTYIACPYFTHLVYLF